MSTQDGRFRLDQRVTVTGMTHHGETGTIIALYPGNDFLPISVALDNGRRAAYRPDELAALHG
jgi:hypothetical protein